MRRLRYPDAPRCSADQTRDWKGRPADCKVVSTSHIRQRPWPADCSCVRAAWLAVLNERLHRMHDCVTQCQLESNQFAAVKPTHISFPKRWLLSTSCRSALFKRDVPSIASFCVDSGLF